MKLKLSLLLVLLLPLLVANAQITVSPASFPAAGDTLRFEIDTLPPMLNLGSPGGNNDWDFTALTGISTEVLVLDAASGSNADFYPNADIRISFLPGSENYYSLGNNRQELLGFAGTDPFGVGLQTVLNYDPSYLERELPLDYEDTNGTVSSFKIQVAADELPQEIIDALSAVTIDSVRLRVEFDRSDEVDAWGNLTTPAGTFEVLRERREEMVSTKLEILTFIGWIDVTLLAIADFPELAADTTVSYHFWSNDAKLEIAEITVNKDDESEILSTTHYITNETVDIPYVHRDRRDLIAYPNPAIDKVKFDFRNMEPGTYKLSVYNILGRELWNNTYQVNGNLTVPVDISNLRKGTYLYSLIDENGSTLVTKRLLVIRP